MPSNAVDLFKQYDLIMDGTDNFATRYLVNDAAVLAGKPYVWGSIYRFEGQVSVFWEDAPDGRGLNYRDLYPEPPPPGLVPSCAEGGVLGMVCASIASVMGTEAIKLITGIGEPLLGRLMIYDALEMSYRTISRPQGPGHAEDHRTDRLRAASVARCPRMPLNVAGLDDHPAGVARVAGLGQEAGPDRRARAGGVGHRAYRRRPADPAVADQLR